MLVPPFPPHAAAARLGSRALFPAPTSDDLSAQLGEASYCQCPPAAKRETGSRTVLAVILPKLKIFKYITLKDLQIKKFI